MNVLVDFKLEYYIDIEESGFLSIVESEICKYNCLYITTNKIYNRKETLEFLTNILKNKNIKYETKLKIEKIIFMIT